MYVLKSLMFWFGFIAVVLLFGYMLNVIFPVPMSSHP